MSQHLDEITDNLAHAQLSKIFDRAAPSPQLKRQLEASLEFETQRNVRTALGRALGRIGSFVTDAGISLGHAGSIEADDVIELRKMLTDAAAMVDGALAEFER